MKVAIIILPDRIDWTCTSQEQSEVVQVHEIIRIVTEHGGHRPMHKTALVAATALRARGIEVDVEDRSFGPL